MLEGPLFGGILGLVMGVTSLLSALLSPDLSSPFFLRPEISILPRILIGLVAAGVFRLLARRVNRSWAAGLAAAAGTLTNTI
ncbi:MAG: ECF transporter S component, partial [Christensenellaceae bacterium]